MYKSNHGRVPLELSSVFYDPEPKAYPKDQQRPDRNVKILPSPDVLRAQKRPSWPLVNPAIQAWSPPSVNHKAERFSLIGPDHLHLVR